MLGNGSWGACFKKYKKSEQQRQRVCNGRLAVKGLPTNDDPLVVVLHVACATGESSLPCLQTNMKV